MKQFSDTVIMMKSIIIFLSALLMICCVIGCQNHRGKADELKEPGHYVLFGDIVKPGKFELPSTSHLTVSQAILKSNGLARLAYGKKVKVIRRVPNHRMEAILLGGFINRVRHSNIVILVDVEAILRGDRQKEDPVVQPWDVIIVEDPWYFLKNASSPL